MVLYPLLKLLYFVLLGIFVFVLWWVVWYGKGWLFLNLLLCSIIEVRWCIASVLILVRAFVILNFGIWKVSLIF